MSACWFVSPKCGFSLSLFCNYYVVARKRDDACHADMLSSDLNTTEGQCDAARLRISSGGPAGAFLTAIPGGSMPIGNDMFVVYVLQRWGTAFPLTWPPAVLMQCRSCYRSRSCDGLREGSQHDPDVSTWDVPTWEKPCTWSSMPAAANRRWTLSTGPWPARRAWLNASAGVTSWLCMLPRLQLAAVDVVVAHACLKSYAGQVAKTAGWTAVRDEETKRTRFRKDVPDHAAFRFVPFAVETCG